MTAQELIDIISHGETTTVEYKSWIKCRGKSERNNLMVKSVVALANASGGLFLFGVEDDGTVTGCTEHDCQSVMECIYDMTRPNQFTEVETVDLNDHVVLVVHVEKSNVPVATSSGTYFKRLGKNSKPFYPGSGMYSVSENADFSAKIVDGATYADIDLLEVYKLKEKLLIRDANAPLADISDTMFLDNLELIKQSSDGIKLTVAGLLFVGKSQAIKSLLPQAEVVYLHYSSSDHQEYDNRLDMQMPIISILDILTERIRSHNRLTNIQVGLYRLEIYDFPEAVFQEALLNALTHRSYESMSAVYVKHYPDKIIIENPGGFPEDVTVNNIITHQSTPRNKLIAMTLQRLKYVQRSGQGVDIMYRSMIMDGKPYPEYTVAPASIRLTLHSAMESQSFVRFIAEEQERIGELFGLPKLMILRHLFDHKKISLSQAAKLIQESQDTAHMELEKLRSQQLIEPTGREYMLTARVYETLKTEIAYVQDKVVSQITARSRIIDYLKRKNIITNSVVQELCGFSKTQAQYILKLMCNEGVLIRIGVGRGTKYKFPTE